jgi:hypothetical protein
MFSKREICMLAGALVVSASAGAQEHDVLRHKIEFQAHAQVLEDRGARVFMRDPAPADGIEFIASEMLPGKVVKGAPYSAEAVTESVQTLADGNRITRRSTAAVARDTEGRTRRESELSGFGPLAAEDAPKLAFINDPVSNTHYILDEKNRTARKMAVFHTETSDGRTFERKIAVRGPGIETEQHIAIPDTAAIALERVHAQKAETKEEDLGTRAFDGVQAKGTRRTITIPAGQIGNDRAIEIVSEQWVSPELQTLVYRKHSDPRMGETTYRLTSISRAEPSKSLFEVPADYKVIEATAGKPFELKLKKQP